MKNLGQSNKGQIVVEYVLLLTLSVTLALLLTKGIVSRNSDNPGFLISKWRQLIELVASDVPENLNTP